MVPARDTHIFYALSHYIVLKKQAHKYHSPILFYSKIKYSSTQCTCWILYWDIYYYLPFIIPLKKACRFCFYFSYYPKSPYFVFISQKSSKLGGKYMCIPLGNMGSTKEIFSITITIFVLPHNNFENSTQIS